MLHRAWERAAREDQRRSFAYGNAKLSNPAITRKMVNDAAEKLRNEKQVDIEAVLAKSVKPRVGGGSGRKKK